MKVLPGLKRNLLIGRSFWVDHLLNLGLGAGEGSICVKGKIFFGPVRFPEQWEDSELIESLVEDEEIDSKISDMNLSKFSTGKELQEALRSLLWEKKRVLKSARAITNTSHISELIEGSELVFFG